ncbi:hypothetical protein [Simplicispira lacusdiani]|uniref:hypothetical protein n=1 Tax=Simplicispira lacusdiani TaxID=2213010 RepID=UPI0013008493|nr:hypothetical protein [Simplicispira lacusdiani]
MDNSGQALYGPRKWLIDKGLRQIARFLCKVLPRTHHLSRRPLDNAVDKSGQALYGRAKSLILQDNPCAASFCGKCGAAAPAATAAPNHYQTDS